jgi:D-sedoheptulose 7-phosphate isomerase
MMRRGGKETSLDVRMHLDDEFAEHGRVWEQTRDVLRGPVAELVQACAAALREGKKLLLFGNGGSAADAQHIAAELTGRFRHNRAPLAAIALTTDTSALTAIGNDFGFECLFSRQVQALGRPGDVAIGISTSGNSENVNRALVAAREGGLVAAGLCGGKGGRMREIASPVVMIPSSVTSRIQEMHILIGHLLCSSIEKELGFE